MTAQPDDLTANGPGAGRDVAAVLDHLWPAGVASPFDDGDDIVVFADETPETPVDGEARGAAPAPWKILVVDDDPGTRGITRLALQNTRFRGAGLHFIEAASARAARACLAADPDIAVALIDVVMETETAGLDLVRRIRDDLGNRAVRLILRTGQPGQAPEHRVIVDYDINDYKAKSELTTHKLSTTVIAALRGYADITALEAHRRGLRTVLEAADALFHEHTMAGFGPAALGHLVDFLGAGGDAVLCARDGKGGAPLRVVAARGTYADFAGRALEKGDAEGDALYARVETTLRMGETLRGDGWTCLYIPAPDGAALVACLAHDGPLSGTDDDLVRLLCARIGSGFANVRLYEELRRTNAVLEQRVAERTRQLEEANESLQHLATVDPLTGAWNRRHFRELAENEMDRAARYGRPLTVAMLDVDHFKAVNDEHGHTAGDAVLADVVARLRERLRSVDLLGRYGGEEFALVLPETDPDAALAAAERLRRAVAAAPVMLADGTTLEVTISLGVTRVTAEDGALDGPINRADAALYAAKAAGRDRVVPA